MLELDASNRREFVVKAEGRSEGMQVVASFRSPQGHACRQVATLDKRGEASFDDVIGDTVVLEMIGGDGARILTQRFSLAGAGRQVVHLAQAGGGRTLRIVNAAGEPLPGVQVGVRLSADTSTWGLALNADKHGEVYVGPLVSTVAVVDLTHPDRGRSFGHEIALADEGDDPQEIVFDPRASLRLHLADEGLPLAGLDVRVFHPETNALVAGHSTASDGTVHLERISAGPYPVRVEQTGYWTREFVTNADLGVQSKDVQIHRTGAADIRLLSKDSVPLAGVDVELTHLVLDEKLTEWVAASRLVAPLATDVRGRLLVPGIPHGTYLFEAHFPNGETIAQTIEVEPNGSTASIVTTPW